MVIVLASLYPGHPISYNIENNEFHNKFSNIDYKTCRHLYPGVDVVFGDSSVLVLVKVFVDLDKEFTSANIEQCLMKKFSI